MVYGAIEAGGTKFVCAVANDVMILETTSFPTTTPEETMQKVVQFFKQFAVKAIGIGCFGPIDMRRTSPMYGHILQTPKIAWQNYNFLGLLQEQLNVPMFWQTDVNVAAYGEYMVGAAQHVDSCIYLTFGTGVGGGYVAQGQFLPTLLHQEMGHMHLKRLEGDTFKGSCPFHGDCVEGLVSGTAIEARTGKKGYDIDSSDEQWDITAKYIAQALQAYTMILSPHQIILGGGVMQQAHLLPKIRTYFVEYVANYIDFGSLGTDIEDYLVLPKHPGTSALLGAIELAKTLVV